MKSSLLAFLFFVTTSLANATSYYFSVNGSDANNGTSPSTPWQTISKFNSVFASKSVGDNFLFNRGDIFYGNLIISRSGSSGLPITIGAYGTGANPVITGLTTVNAWTNLGSNIWESTNAISTLATCNMVVINGVNTPMGRFPNTGYFPYQSFSGATSITSSSLNSSVTNWTGAQVVVRKNNFITDRDLITGHAGGTMTFISNTTTNGTAGNGFYIENDSRTLDIQNEWYYNPSTKKLRIFSTLSPSNVQLTTKDTLVTIIVHDFITFDGLTFSGSNKDAFTIKGSKNVTIQNCTFDYSGQDVIWGAQNAGTSSANFVFKNNLVTHTNNNGLTIESEFLNYLISNNTFKNTGLNDGMGGNGSGNYSSLNCINVVTANGTVELNNIDSVGYIGINFTGSNVIIRNNFITHFAYEKIDGGAIYGAGSTGSNRQILNNIILNSIGSNAGTSQTGAVIAHGIYMDDNTTNVEIGGNTCANIQYSGLFMHNTNNCKIHDNTFYNNGTYQKMIQSFLSGNPSRNITVNQDINFAATASQKAADFESATNDIPSFGIIDNNYYARPIDDNMTINAVIQRNLSQWVTFSAFDSHSGKSPKNITTVNDLRFEYNPTSVSKTISLGATYIDVKNVSYPGSITLQPYSSAVLILNGVITNQSPVANAGGDQSITLPTNSLTLSGSGIDSDGTISSYQWTKISGPSSYNILSPTSAGTSLTGLVQGAYQFQLKVTDNNGASGKDTMLVTVNAAPNQPPAANAGPDQSITLPSNSVTLSGSGTDPDGTISSYKWTKISGPSSYNIINANVAATSVAGLIQGVYQFQLTVTDNNGATGTDVVLITVNTAVNISPVANAGMDQMITLPTNTITLSGSGSDADGTIVTYLWTQISGPAGNNIVNANSPVTDVAGLIQGTYQFQLTVTDNSGAIGTDIIQVTVNAAVNIAPTANAGTNQSVTLPTNSITLSGSGSDVDGTIVSYSWSQISGPSGYNILNVNSAGTNVTGLVQGIYQFQLTVTDNSGAIGTDIIQVTVNAAVNIAPTANAGTNQSITLPTNSIALSGSGSDIDGTVVNYTWTEISGPSGSNIVNANSPGTNVTGLVQGAYQFQLTVTDNSGAIGTDIIQVTVNAAPNQSPVANAGSDQTITLPTNTVTLSGSGSDTDGTVVSYTWTLISGPSGYNIVNANSPVSDVTGLLQGVYLFQLEVTDNNGATGTDIIQVTVNAAINIPPIANAGLDQTITLPINTITLSGSGSDADGTVVNYTWTEISGPSGYNIVNANSPFTDVTGLVQGTYQFQLQVTDNNGATGIDIIQVVVNPAANIPPIANAGLDQTITLPTNSITLSGSGSDADGTVVSYTWTEISGPSGYNIVNANSAGTDVTGLVQGTYQFQLEVTDNNGAIGTDIIQLTVNTVGNISPVANAGSDQTVTLPTNSITLSGSGNDVDGTIVSYSWSQISGPSGYNIVNANSPGTNVTGLVQGTYQFQLQVTDNNGATGTDIIQVIVNPAPNIAPVANAGLDQTIALPTNMVTLSGSGSDADGTVVSYTWTLISGPSGYNIVNANSAGTDVTGLVQGSYQFQLQVTDNNGATGIDIIQVIVNPAANIPPIANAGLDQTITLPINSITLPGSGSDADGTIASYTWTEISGPSGYNIVNANSAGTDVTGLVQGSYQFQLQVTDNNGATGIDIIQVIVNPAANMPPIANAGLDQTITLPTNSITLSGSGNDPDGTIASYTWTEISGPSGYNIVNANSAGTDVSGLVQGTYQFQLQVTDNNGAVGIDLIQVIVNPVANIPPVANAGLDQTITLPANSVTLSGNGNDVDGVIISNAWTKISGPSGSNIIDGTSFVTNVTSLVQGVYQFQLLVTDDNGATGIDTIQVTVDAATNIPPVANAGLDQTITLPTNSLTVSGSGSDADGTVVNYQWTKISGPSGYSIGNPTSSSTNITGLAQGVYQFELQVTDNNGATGIDTIQITVNIAGNISPIANAGANKTITLPIDSVLISGSGSDADGTVVSYAWTKMSGPASYSIVNPTSAGTVISGLVQGVYLFELTVTDNNGATGTDIMQITVNAAPNVAPVANAGTDLTITLPTNSVTVSGSGSDADGTVVSYSWTKISGPSSYNIVNAASAVTDINGLVKGVYKFQLKVTDNKGATGIDVVKITVNAAPNQAPIANAGSDWTITLPTNTLLLSGSGSDADGTVVSYQWTKISGPSSYSIVSPTSAVTSINGLVQGVYQFQLKVTDNKGATGTDIMQVTVNAAPNVPPIANAGSDLIITLPVNSVSVSGSGSDADGTVVSYTWTKISGPASYNIINPTSAITAINGLVQGVYQFQLKVTDNNGATGIDIMQVTVNAAPNQPPIANAGLDKTITLPIDSVLISGSGSDADGTVVSYAWTKMSGPASYSIVNPTSAGTVISGLVQGVYLFELTVTDNNGATGTDIMQITVNAAPNVAPVANAGTDLTITLPTNSVTVSGSGSDADGTVVSYSWTKISGPSSYNIVNSTSAVTAINGLVQGVYQFQLKVTDDNGATGTDIMQITVNAAPNQAPIANAGSDWTITLPTNTLLLSGSGSDADGTVVSYQWTKISGPSSYSIVSPTSAVTSINGLVQGVYQFQLKVTDNKGATGTDIMQVTVNAAPNVPPIANAGSDLIITLPVNSVSVSGSGSDADGTVVSYTWTKISGPASYNIINPTSAITAINGLVQGVYQFQLKVTDNNGATGIDIMQVTVNAAPNQPPIANAGLDKTITLPIDSVLISGSGSDADGTVVSYAWTKMSGPASYSIVNPTSAGTVISGLVQGVYLFELTVTDNNGATGTDIMQITVNAAPNVAPVANAGTDLTITLPTNSVTVSGSGSDADGTVVSYSWTKISGPSSYNIVNSTSAVTAINGLVQGVYQFQLKVTDDNGATGTDIMQITVNAAPNQAPIANAGSDWTITLPTNTLLLSGSGSDADGTVVSYQWTKISGPSSYSIVSPTSAVTSINGLVQGVYQFQLKVTDNKGATGTDIMQVTVNAAPNVPPIANAGSDLIITLPVNSVSVSGSGSDADGTVVSYTWTKISGPASYNIINPTSAITAINGLVQGVYQFQLKVTDNNGATGIDIMQVTVNVAANIPPVADGGPDNIITLPINSLTVSGSGSDTDGTIVGYQWTKISGPASYNIVNPTSAVTAINNLVEGLYKFELRVTDNNGARGRDTIQVIVNAAVINKIPVANAGTGQTITLPTNSVTLSGSGTDIDGSIIGYSWKQISGPSNSVIDSSNNPITLSNELVGGTYQFELSVTDDMGAIGRDTVSIVVAEPRINSSAQSNGIKAYPNPVVDETTLEINTSHVYSKLLLTITDMKGEIVYKKEIVSGQTNIKEKINMSNLIKGTYLITIYYGDKTRQSIKVIRL